MKIKIVFLLITIIIFSGCSSLGITRKGRILKSAQILENYQHYSDALESLSDGIFEYPEDKKILSAYKSTFKKGTSILKKSINTSIGSGDYENVAFSYEELLKMNSNLSQLKDFGVEIDLDVEDIEELKKETSKYYYMAAGTIPDTGFSNNRTRYKYYQKSKKYYFMPNVDEKLAEYEFYSKINLLFLPSTNVKKIRVDNEIYDQVYAELLREYFIKNNGEIFGKGFIQRSLGTTEYDILVNAGEILDESVENLVEKSKSNLILKVSLVNYLYKKPEVNLQTYERTWFENEYGKDDSDIVEQKEREYFEHNYQKSTSLLLEVKAEIIEVSTGRIIYKDAAGTIEEDNVNWVNLTGNIPPDTENSFEKFCKNEEELLIDAIEEVSDNISLKIASFLE